MRFDITFELTDHRQHTLPINYQYPMSSWIYKTLELVNEELSKELHDEGYGLGTKQFKLFTFSNLRFGKYGYDIVRPDRLYVKKDRCWLTVSLVVDKTIHSFVMGIFKDMSLRIGDKNSGVPMRIVQINRLEGPDFEEGVPHCFQTISPICVSDREEGNRLPQYLSPEDVEFERIFIHNLHNKYLVMQKNGLLKEGEVLPDDWEKRCSFRLLGGAKKKVITIKDHTPQKTKYRAYEFKFELSAPKLLLEIGYKAGFGEKNSMGFGCCKEVG